MTTRNNLRYYNKLLTSWNFATSLVSNHSTVVNTSTSEEVSQAQNSDEKLVSAAQRGDTKAFETLILKYQRQIFNLIYQMTHNVEIVEDIGQDVFVAAFRAIKDFKSKSSFFTWLYRIAINHCKNYLASSTRSQDIEKRYRTEQEINEFSEDDYEKNPQSMLLAKEFVEQLEAVMTSLPPEQRIVLTLCEFQGFSYQQIAEVLECPIGTVRSRLSRARATLQEHLNSSV